MGIKKYWDLKKKLRFVNNWDLKLPNIYCVIIMQSQFFETQQTNKQTNKQTWRAQGGRQKLLWAAEH
jgi:hypothetical protein